MSHLRSSRTLKAAGRLLLAMAIQPGATAAQVPQPGTGSNTPPTAKEEQRQKAAAQRPLVVFEFHSGFWLNLHHFLYQQARIRAQRPTSRLAPGADTPAPLARTDALSPEQRRAWAASLDYYATAMVGRDLLFDGDMVLINNRLAELEAEPDLHRSGLRQELVDALERAAPIYRPHWWPEQERADRAWIAAVRPMLEEVGATLARQLASVYRADWPPGRIRVDVTTYAGLFGAYTSLDPLRVTIASTDPRNQGPAAVEVLFHEASHALAGAVRDGIARESRVRNKPIPRDLWHALLFYTTGEVVKRSLSNYTPYAYRFGLYDRGWQNYQRMLERHWQPYLDGRDDFDTALARLVAAL